MLMAAVDVEYSRWRRHQSAALALPAHSSRASSCRGTLRTISATTRCSSAGGQSRRGADRATPASCRHRAHLVLEDKTRNSAFILTLNASKRSQRRARQTGRRPRVSCQRCPHELTHYHEMPCQRGRQCVCHPQRPGSTQLLACQCIGAGSCDPLRLPISVLLVSGLRISMPAAPHYLQSCQQAQAEGLRRCHRWLLFLAGRRGLGRPYHTRVIARKTMTWLLFGGPVTRVVTDLSCCNEARRQAHKGRPPHWRCRGVTKPIACHLAQASLQRV
jgi:hypothetical protein